VATIIFDTRATPVINIYFTYIIYIFHVFLKMSSTCMEFFLRIYATCDPDKGKALKNNAARRIAYNSSIPCIVLYNAFFYCVPWLLELLQCILAFHLASKLYNPAEFSIPNNNNTTTRTDWCPGPVLRTLLIVNGILSLTSVISIAIRIFFLFAATVFYVAEGAPMVRTIDSTMSSTTINTMSNSSRSNNNNNNNNNHFEEDDHSSRSSHSAGSASFLANDNVQNNNNNNVLSTVTFSASNAETALLWKDRIDHCVCIPGICIGILYYTIIIAITAIAFGPSCNNTPSSWLRIVRAYVIIAYVVMGILITIGFVVCTSVSLVSYRMLRHMYSIIAQQDQQQQQRQQQPFVNNLNNNSDNNDNGSSTPTSMDDEYNHHHTNHGNLHHRNYMLMTSQSSSGQAPQHTASGNYNHHPLTASAFLVTNNSNNDSTL